MSSESDISNTISDTYDGTQNVATIAKREVGDLKNQGMKAVKNVASQAKQDIGTMSDSAAELKKSVLDYVSEKPGKSFAIALAALYLFRKLTR